jgi:hypothetical protein
MSVAVVKVAPVLHAGDSGGGKFNAKIFDCCADNRDSQPFDRVHGHEEIHA